MSLRTKYAVLVLLASLLPTGVYLVLDFVFIREALLASQVDSLTRVAWVVAAGLDPSEDLAAQAQSAISRYQQTRSDLDILVIHTDNRVLAATGPHRTGQPWPEVGIGRVLRGQERSTWAVMKHEGLWVLDVTVPVTSRDGTIVGAIHLARHLGSVEAEMDNIKWRHGLFVLLAAIGTTLLLSLGTYWLVLRRLHLLDEALRAQDSRRQLPPTAGPRDEIDHLGVVLAGLVDELGSAATRLKVALSEKEDLLGRVQGFNTRLEQEVEKVRAELTSAQQRLIQAEHLSTIGQLAAGLAHEVRNPLFIIRATAVRLQKKNIGQRAACDDIIDEVDRVNRIIKRLLEIGRATELSTQEVTLADTLERIADSVRRRLRTGHQVMVNVDASKECRVQGDPHLLRQAFANIVDNAIHAVGNQGQVTIAARHLGGHTLVEVRDDGVGIAKEDVDRIFDPFFSRNLGGTGLGLCSAKKVLDLHGAFVEVESEVGEGTTVRIIFGAFDAVGDVVPPNISADGDRP